jgi:hypothetical protein
LVVADRAIINSALKGFNMDYFLIFTLSNVVALFITYSYLIKKAKVITLPALIKGTWIYGTIISMLIVIPYYLYT